MNIPQWRRGLSFGLLIRRSRVRTSVPVTWLCFMNKNSRNGYSGLLVNSKSRWMTSLPPSDPHCGSMVEAESAKNSSLNHYSKKTTTLFVATYNCLSLTNESKLTELEKDAGNIKWDVI